MNDDNVTGRLWEHPIVWHEFDDLYSTRVERIRRGPTIEFELVRWTIDPGVQGAIDAICMHTRNIIEARAEAVTWLRQLARDGGPAAYLGYKRLHKG